MEDHTGAQAAALAPSAVCQENCAEEDDRLWCHLPRTVSLYESRVPGHFVKHAGPERSRSRRRGGFTGHDAQDRIKQARLYQVPVWFTLMVLLRRLSRWCALCDLQILLGGVRRQDREHTFEALLYDHLVNHRRGQTEWNRLPTTDRDRTGRSSRDTRYLEHLSNATSSYLVLSHLV